MRGIYSSVTDIRRQVFTEVARMAYEGGDYSRVEELPYKILPGEVSKYRDSIFLERAIVGERLRLAMGLPCGELVLTVAVLAILITAPLGAFAIDRTFPRLLQSPEEN